jgi:hypothetical protein
VDSTQFQELASSATTERQSIFGGSTTNISYDGGTKVLGYWTPVRTQQQLDEVGFRDVHDTIVRVAKTNLASVEIGKTLTLFTAAGITISQVRVNEFGNSTFNPEWVLGCTALF